MSKFKDIQKKQEQNDQADADKLIIKCSKIAKKIIKLISDGEYPLGDIQDKSGQMKEECTDQYREITIKVISLMMVEKMVMAERNIVFQLVLQAFEQVKMMTINSLERNSAEAFKKIAGEYQEEMTLEQIDDILTGKNELVMEEVEVDEVDKKE